VCIDTHNMNDSDQITLKVHNFVPIYIKEMVEELKATGVKFESEIGLIDIAVLRLKDQIDEGMKNPIKMKELMEGLLNDAWYLTDEKIVKVNIRNIQKREKKNK